jgi:hypothetical protein
MSADSALRRTMITVAVITFFLQGVATPAALAQPSNDAFAAATEVTALPFTDSVDLTDATTEAGELTDHCAPVAGTVWYAIRADGSVDVDTAGSTADTVLAVFEGDSLDTLQLVVCNDDPYDSESFQAALTFEASPDRTMYVQAGVLGDSVDDGSQLEITFTQSVPPPPPPPIKKHGRPFRSQYGENVEFVIAEWEEKTGDFSQGVLVGETSWVWTHVSAVDGMWYEGWGKTGDRSRDQAIEFHHIHKVRNEDTGETVRTEYEAYARLPRKAFTFNPSLRYATLVADVETYAYRCVSSNGGPVGSLPTGVLDSEDSDYCEEIGYPTVRLDIRWEGRGDIYRDRIVDTNIESALHTHDFLRFSMRDATADGTITISGIDQPVVDHPADVFAALLRSAEGARFLWWE